MRTSRFWWASVVMASTLAAAPSMASAQTPNPQALQVEIDQLRKDFDAVKQQYGDRLSALEAQLAAIRGGQTGAPPSAGAPQQPAAQVPEGAAGAGGPTGTLPVYGTPGAAVSGA